MDHLSEPTSAIRFFRITNIADITKIQSIHPYSRSDERKGLVYIATEKDGGENLQIIIDVTQGPPSTDQLGEVIYGAGANSNKRILVYTGDNNDVEKDNPTADLGMVKRLVTNFNDYLLDLFLVRIDISESKPQTFEFNVEVQPEYPIKEPLDSLAPERSFREFEF